MREIKPYKTLLGAQRSLDNGGRFYNVFAKSGDDIVDSAELARAAGFHFPHKAIIEQVLQYSRPQGLNLQIDQ